MPLQIGPLLSGDDPNKPKDPNQQQMQLIGAAGGPSLPGQPSPEGGGIDFQSMFPQMERTPITQATAIRDTSGLMFNPEFAQRNLGLQRMEADLGLNRTQNQQAVNQEYERNVTKANTMQTQARKKLMERMSGQGILQSGIHGQQQGELNTAHQGYLDDLGYARAAGLAGVESDYANRMNQIALQREGLFGEQQQVEEQRRLEAARVEAERQAQAQAAAQQEAMLAEMARQQQASQAAMLAQIQAQQYSAPSFSGGGYQGYTPQQPNWQAGPAAWEDVYNWSNKMRNNYGSNRDAFNADITRLLQSDPNWAGSMMNAMGSYYGGAQGIGDVLNWLWFPLAPKLNRGISDSSSQQYANMGVM